MHFTIRPFSAFRGSEKIRATNPGAHRETVLFKYKPIVHVR